MSHLIGKALRSGVLNLINQGHFDDSNKRGVLRGGNAGMCLIEKDIPQFYNSCPRLVLLRYLGYQETITEDRIHTQRMFYGGENNELAFIKRLEASNEFKEKGLTIHQDYANSLELESGIKLTGRADIVIKDAKGKIIQGIENKRMSSFWTVRDILLKYKAPKFVHICQAGLYAHILGDVPWSIWYTSDCNFALPKGDYVLREIKTSTIKKQLKKYIQYWKDKEIGAINKAEVGFELKNVKGEYHYRMISEEGEILTRYNPTGVTVDSILQFYNIIGHWVKEWDTTDYLPLRPKDKLCGGDTAPYTTCRKYCQMKDICNGDNPPCTPREFVQRALDSEIYYMPEQEKE